MNVKAQLKSYEKLDFAINISAPVCDWRAMLKQLDKLKDSGWVAWPASGLVCAIEKMLSDLDKTHSDTLLKDDQLAAASD